jgi:hypothetical protein
MTDETATQRVEIPEEFYYFHNGCHVTDLEGDECPLQHLKKKVRVKMENLWTLLSKLRCGFCGDDHNTFSCVERDIALKLGLIQRQSNRLVLEDGRCLKLEYKPAKHSLQFREVEERRSRKIAQEIGGCVQSSDLLSLEVFVTKDPVDTNVTGAPGSQRETVENKVNLSNNTQRCSTPKVFQQIAPYLLGTPFYLRDPPSRHALSSPLQLHVRANMFARGSPLFFGSRHYNLVEVISKSKCLFCGEIDHNIINCDEHQIFDRLAIVNCDEHGYYLRTGKRVTLVPDGLKYSPELIGWLQEAFGCNALHPEVVSSNINVAASRLELPVWWVWYAVAKSDLHTHHRQRCTGK